jgi:hypothetical protein
LWVSTHKKQIGLAALGAAAAAGAGLFFAARRWNADAEAEA